jgi:uncharacterized phosphosugar-binding protein
VDFTALEGKGYGMDSQDTILLKDVGAHASALIAPAIRAAGVNAGLIAFAADEIVKRVTEGGQLFAFGAGHAYAFAAELCSRAGGLPHWASMNLEDLRETQRLTREQLHDSLPERDPAKGVALAELHGLKSGDVLVIASQSGRNGASAEMAVWARTRGVYVIGVLSRDHSAAYPSRHPAGLKLVTESDVVLDLCTPTGDAALISDSGKRVASTSTIAFALLAQLLNARITLALEARGLDPKVLTSANVDPVQN